MSSKLPTAKPTGNSGSITDLPLIKRGSVKNLRGPLVDASSGRSVSTIVFEFSDDFSVFDWGKMPDTIPGKGKALLLLAAHLFRELSHPASWRSFFASEAGTGLAAVSPELRRELESVGMRSCFRGTWPRGQDNDPQGLVVEALAAIPPKRVDRADGSASYDYSGYPKNVAGTLVPLEVVFRHSLVDKSSWFERNPGTQLRPGHRFETPMVEFFTKLEHSDRFIATREEACVVGRITEEKLREIENRTILLASWLRRECGLRGLELVDGKFEWGFDSEGRLLLADAIGPDELRLMEGREGLSKEFLREALRGSRWFEEIQALKKAGRQNPGWQKLVREPAPMLSRDPLARATALYRRLEARFRPETVLLFGSGAREHEIARRLLDSPNLRTLIWAPGQDAGFAQLERAVSRTLNADRKRLVRWEDSGWKAERADELVRRAREAGVTLVIFSQDSDLAAGAADLFRMAGFPVFGPSKEAARIEWSKSFMKELCTASGVPTARSHVTESAADAVALLRELDWNDRTKWVVKADGLALGKGVVVAETREEAIASLDALSKYGSRFVIEERLRGEECSWFAFSDGEAFSLLDPAKDYKRLLDGQKGPNTGGMGSVSPAPGTTSALRERVRNEVFAPIFAEMRKRGIRFQGLLYAGLMIDRADGEERLMVLEFNARFGDPETQALLPRLETGPMGDLLLWMGACARGTLVDLPRDVPFRKVSAVYVVAASEGYPEAPRTGAPVEIADFALEGDSFRFAGLKRAGSCWEVSGGRVLGATGIAETPEAARKEAYRALEGVIWSGAQIRKDIGT
jgi:phosphoribosylamine--glycine ligase